MSQHNLLLIAIAVAVIGGLVAILAGRGGPRVTHIDRTVRKQKDVDDA